MVSKTFLLALSGSEQSRYASELAWVLAERVKARLVAVHVIDSPTAWELLGQERPGFIGSEPYTSAYDTLCASMRLLARRLMRAYEVAARSHHLDSERIIDEGNPVAQLCHRASASDLVIIGHQPRRRDEARKAFVRASVAEGLAHECPRPLLVVQQECRPWSRLRIVISPEHINEQYVNAALALGLTLDMLPELLVLATGVTEEAPDKLVEDLREANPFLEDIPITVRLTGDAIIEDDLSLTWIVATDVETGACPDTLVVIPTRQAAGSRITVLGSSPDVFIRTLTMPAILLWPEESVSRLPSVSPAAAAQA